MRDPRVFGRWEESLPDNTEEGQPLTGPDPLVEEDEKIPYGSALSEIQTSDLTKCSFRGVLPLEHSSSSMPLRRLSLELKNFLKDHPSYISVAPIGDNIVRHSYLHPQDVHGDSSLI